MTKVEKFEADTLRQLKDRLKIEDEIPSMIVAMAHKDGKQCFAQTKIPKLFKGHLDISEDNEGNPIETDDNIAPIIGLTISALKEQVQLICFIHIETVENKDGDKFLYTYLSREKGVDDDVMTFYKIKKGDFMVNEDGDMDCDVTLELALQK
jgi:hypothetical protein